MLTGVFGRALNEGMTASDTIASAIIGLVSYLAVHGYSIATKGQMFGIKMVDNTSGELVSLAKIIVLRDLPMASANVIPFVGSRISLIDILASFGSQQRCIHDHLAGTQVVRA